MAASPSSEPIAPPQRAAVRAPAPGLGREEEALCLAARVAPAEAAQARLAALLDAGIDWDRLWRLGHVHEVLPLLVTSITALDGPARMPERWSADAQRRRSATLLQNRSLLGELLATLDAMGAVGVEAIPVKGLVLTEMLYGNLALRPAGDIDVLVRPEDLPAARDALRGLGYAQEAVPAYEERHHPFHDPPYYREGPFRQTAIELHHGLAAPRQFRMDAASLWERSVTTELFGRPIRVLGPEDTLLHLAIHRARAPLRLRWIVDIAELTASVGRRARCRVPALAGTGDRRPHDALDDPGAVRPAPGRPGRRRRSRMASRSADRSAGSSNGPAGSRRCSPRVPRTTTGSSRT